MSAQSDVQLNQSKFNYDSGACQHIWINSYSFIKIADLKYTITVIVNGAVDVTGEGSAKFNDGQLLEYVLFALDAANLISISAATKKSAKFVFAGDNIYVGRTIVGKRVSNGLYECLFLIGSVALVSFNIHDRLGHRGAPAEAIAATHYGVSNEKHSNCASCYRSRYA